MQTLWVVNIYLLWNEFKNKFWWILIITYIPPWIKLNLFRERSLTFTSDNISSEYTYCPIETIRLRLYYDYDAVVTQIVSKFHQQQMESTSRKSNSNNDNSSLEHPHINSSMRSVPQDHVHEMSPVYATIKHKYIFYGSHLWSTRQSQRPEWSAINRI